VQFNSIIKKTIKLEVETGKNSNSFEEDLLVSPVANHNNSRINFALERNHQMKKMNDISLYNTGSQIAID